MLLDPEHRVCELARDAGQSDRRHDRTDGKRLARTRSILPNFRMSAVISNAIISDYVFIRMFRDCFGVGAKSVRSSS